MMIVIYCDACIYRDYYEWRPGHAWIHYGEEAKKLFDKVKNKEFVLVISDHLEYQLKGFPQYKIYLKEIKENGNLIEVKTTSEDKQKASNEAENNQHTEYEDALHAELAIRARANILVTSNIEHFKSFEERIKIRRPELTGLF